MKVLVNIEVIVDTLVYTNFVNESAFFWDVTLAKEYLSRWGFVVIPTSFRSNVRPFVDLLCKFVWGKLCKLFGNVFFQLL